MSNYMSRTSNTFATNLIGLDSFINTRITNITTDQINLGTSNRFIVNNRYKNDLYIDGTLYASNLYVYGSNTVIQTDTYRTENMQIVSMTNDGPALMVTQMGIDDVAEFYDANSNVFMIKKGGNVGIANANPQERLDIIGNIKFTGKINNVLSTELDFVNGVTSSIQTQFNNTNTNASNYVSSTSNFITNNLVNTSNAISNRLTTLDSNMSNYMKTTSNFITNNLVNTSNAISNRLTTLDSNMSNYVTKVSPWIISDTYIKYKYIEVYSNQILINQQSAISYWARYEFSSGSTMLLDTSGSNRTLSNYNGTYQYNENKNSILLTNNQDATIPSTNWSTFNDLSIASWFKTTNFTNQNILFEFKSPPESSFTDTTNLQLWYKFNDSVTNMFLDFSGNNYTASSWNSLAKFDSNIYKTGNGSVLCNDSSARVDIPTTFQLYTTYNASTTGITIAFWFKTNCNSTSLLFFHYASTVSGTIRLSTESTNQLKFLHTSVNAQLQTTTVSYITNGTYVDNSWHHLVWSISKTGAWTIYIDNTNLNVNISPLLALPNATYDYYYLGNEGVSTNLYLNIDDFRIYNKLLDSNNVNSLYTISSANNLKIINNNNNLSFQINNSAVYETSYVLNNSWNHIIWNIASSSSAQSFIKMNNTIKTYYNKIALSSNTYINKLGAITNTGSVNISDFKIINIPITTDIENILYNPYKSLVDNLYVSTLDNSMSNYVVTTSNFIQLQLNNKENSIALGATQYALINTSGGKVGVSTITLSELNTLTGIGTTSIITQLNNKESSIALGATQYALINTSGGKVGVSTITLNELNTLTGIGATSIITQLNNKESSIALGATQYALINTSGGKVGVSTITLNELNTLTGIGNISIATQLTAKESTIVLGSTQYALINTSGGKVGVSTITLNELNTLTGIGTTSVITQLNNKENSIALGATQYALINTSGGKVGVSTITLSELNTLTGIGTTSIITQLNNKENSIALGATQYALINTSGGKVGVSTITLNELNTLTGIGTTSIASQISTAKISSQWTTTGNNIYYTTGNVGIGTTNPLFKLQVTTADSATATDLLNFKNTSDYGIYATSVAQSSRGNSLDFLARDYNNGGTVQTRNMLTLRADGNVGIGSTTPAYKLDVVGDINISSGSSFRVNGVAFSGSQWITNGTMVYYNSGNVGIGVTNPAGLLELSSSTQALSRIILSGQEFYQAANTSTSGIACLLGVNRTNNRQLWIGDSANLTQNTTNSVFRINIGDNASSGAMIDSIATNGTTALPLRLGTSGVLTILANTNVGIGTTNPQAKLHISSALATVGNSYPLRISANKFVDNNGTGTFIGLSTEDSSWSKCALGHVRTGPYDVGDMVFLTRNTTDANTCDMTNERMRITSGGNVGIAKTNPQYTLDVTGDVNISGSFRVNGTAFTGSSQWTTSGTIIYYSSGNVGIGMTNPTYKLQINNSIFVGDIANTGTTAGSTANGYRLVFDNTRNGTAGSGTPANKIVLHNNGTSWLGGFGIENGAVTYHSGGNHNFYTGSTNTPTYGTLRMTILSNGNVGIGTTNPGGTVTIIGQQASTTGVGVQGTLCLIYNGGWNAGDLGSCIVFSQRWYSGTSDYISVGMIAGVKTNTDGNFGGGLTFWTGPPGLGNFSERMRIVDNGNVGIGTNGPSSILNIYEANGTTAGANSGSLIIDHGNNGGASSITFRSAVNRGSDYGYIQYQDTATVGGAGESAQLIIGTQNDGDDHILLMPSGNVGINVTPSVKLHVSGDIAATGNVTAYYSDERLKTITSNINNPLDIIQNIKGFYYKPNELAHKNGIEYNNQEIGLSAQDVQKVLPEIVKIAPFDLARNKEGELISKSGENYLTLCYERLAPVFVEAMKELNNEIKLLKKENNDLKEKYETMSQEIELIKKILNIKH